MWLRGLLLIIVPFAFATHASASVVLSVMPSPCVIPYGEDLCTTTVSWSAPEGQMVQVWVSVAGFADAQFHCTIGSSSAPATWITAGGAVFKIYSTTSCNPAEIAGKTPGASLKVVGSPSTTPIESTLIQQPSLYSTLYSTVWYEFGPSYEDTLAHLRTEIPQIKAAGFNTVWLVTPWYEVQPQALPTAVWDEGAVVALEQTLDVLRANHMQALIGLNYLGQGWSPQGIDACNWTNDAAMYQAFVDYSKSLLQRLDGYQDVAIIQVFTENAEPCSLNTYTNATQIAGILRQTLGNFPKQLPPDLRAKFRIGYHDYDEINLGWAKGESPIQSPISFDFVSMVAYGLEAMTDTQIQSEIAARAARFKALYPNTPLIIGEYGAVSCASDQDQNQARVDAAILSFAIDNNMGSSLWAWKPMTTSTSNDCTQKLIGAGLNIVEGDGAERPAAESVEEVLKNIPPVRIAFFSVYKGALGIDPVPQGSPATVQFQATDAKQCDMLVAKDPNKSYVDQFNSGAYTTYASNIGSGGAFGTTASYYSVIPKAADTMLMLYCTGKDPDASEVLGVVHIGMSVENSTITPASGGSITTRDGKWTFGASTTVNGSAILRNGRLTGFGDLIVYQSGSSFAHNKQNAWFKWDSATQKWVRYSGDPRIVSQ